MKRIIAILMMLALSVGMLAGCGGEDAITSIPEGMNGKEMASLILANERLNANQLKGSGTIFDDGKETLLDLAEMATVSLAGNTFVTDVNVASEVLLGTEYTALDGSVVEVDGTTFRWSGFKEYSNSYDYFLNLTTGISSSAEMGADLIDSVKKHVRVVDTWVNVYGEEYYLHVEENCEILYARNNDFIRICKRTKNADGSNVYELYRSLGSDSCRMVYIEGKMCEYSYISGGFNHNFLAVNNKGFWEVVDVGVRDTHYNVSCMVIKNDICYDAFYDPSEESRGVGLLKVISSDRATDILRFLSWSGGADITLNLQGFSGYDYIELETTADKIGKLENGDSSRYEILTYEERDRVIYSIGNANSTELVLKNGKRIKCGDVLLDGKISINNIWVSHVSKEPEEGSVIYSGGYVPELMMGVSGETFEEQMANLEEFLAEFGLVCNRDMSSVKASIIQANAELLQFTKYHEWNESPIRTEEDIARGWQNNLAKHEAFKSMYNEIKDASVIDYSDKEAMKIAISFSPIGTQASASVKNNGFTVAVDKLALTVTDTMLFVEDEEYSVFFALVGTGADKTLNHIQIENPTGVAYKSGDTFTVSGSATFEIPTLDLGTYTLVAYVSTKDGIRSSEYTAVKFTEINEVEKNDGNIKISLKKNENNELTVRCTEISDVEVKIADGTYTASAMYEALSKEIYNYGFVAGGAVLEMQTAEGWIEVPDSDGDLASGTYRLKYEIKNGSSVKGGYVFVNY